MVNGLQTLVFETKLQQVGHTEKQISIHSTISCKNEFNAGKCLQYQPYFLGFLGTVADI